MGIEFTEEAPTQLAHSDTERKKIAERRATKMVTAADIAAAAAGNKNKVKAFKSAPKWWQKASIKYAFSHPHVTSRLEKLMGSNLVQLTDRDYMQKLQERILEEYAESMDKRIKGREKEEMERVKNLVLSGRIPLNEAPDCMYDHPIMMIERYCHRLIAERRAKIKIQKVHIPQHLYYDDTPDPPSGLSIENGHVFRKSNERLCNPISRFLPDNIKYDLRSTDDEEEEEDEEAEVEDVEEEEEVIMDEYMFTPEEYERYKYESPLIKELKQCQTVEELYFLADQIIGALKSIEGTETRFERQSSLTSTATSVMPDAEPPTA